MKAQRYAIYSRTTGEILRTYVGSRPHLQIHSDDEDYYPRVSDEITIGAKGQRFIRKRIPERLPKDVSDRTHRIDITTMRPSRKTQEEIEEVNAKERLQELRFAALKAEQDRLLAEGATPEAQAYRVELARHRMKSN